MTASTKLSTNRQGLGAAILAGGLVATLGTALLFQHVGGYIPCALCLAQRTPYYLAIPLALASLLLSATGRAPGVARALLVVVGLIMLWSLALGVHHAGVEWGFWPGPSDCASVGGGDLSAGGLLERIDAVRPPSCDEASGRFLGLSFAGWNALASALWGAIAFAAALAGRRAART